MAARLPDKKKGRMGKRKQPLKNHLQARQKQRKLQPHKQKKLLSRCVTKAKAAGARQMKSCPSKLFASKLLKQMPKKVHMEAKDRHLVMTMLTHLYKLMVSEVKKLGKKNQPFEVSSTEIKTVLNDAMTKLLGKHTAKATNTAEASAAAAATGSSQCA